MARLRTRHRAGILMVMMRAVIELGSDEGVGWGAVLIDGWLLFNKAR